MSNPDRFDIEAALLELTDDDAVSVMEGQLPSSDQPAVEEAASSVAKALLAEPDFSDVSKDGGINVVQFVRRQPWMRMAASVALGVALASVLTTEYEPVSPAASDAVASSNVFFLEAVRSSADDSLPQIKYAGEADWITLIAFPSSTEADAYRIQLRQTNVVTSAGGSQEQLFENVIGAGNQDSIVVNVPAAKIVPGAYSLEVYSLRNGKTVDSTILRFQVQR